MWHIIRTVSVVFFLGIVLITCVLFGPAAVRSLQLHLAQYTNAMYAIHLLNGQVMYGTIRSVGLNTITMGNVHTFETVSVGTTQTSNLQARRTNPLTMPEDWLTIQRDGILYFEELSPAARVLSLMRGE